MVANVNGVELFYEVSGAGRPLVMVHGNGEDHTIFDEAAEYLQQRYTCYRIDSRGHGESSPVSELHYADMAGDVIAFLEQLDLQNVIFYGFSDGGIIGLLAAAECQRITAVIVSGANLTPAGVKPGLRLLLRLIYIFNRDPKIRLMLREPHIGDETLGRIRAKTLVLAGSRDLVLERETRRIAAAIPGAKLKILDGQRHGSYIIHNETIGKLIADFAG